MRLFVAARRDIEDPDGHTTEKGLRIVSSTISESMT